MPTTDPRVTAYIAKSAPFARPVLTHLRAVVHAACPDVIETMKWSTPHFEHHGLMCGMAAFKAHCAFGFWRAALVLPAEDPKAQRAMGQFGRITSLDDLPGDRVLAQWIRKAARLNESGERPRTPPKRPRPALRMPADLAAALARHAKASAHWAAFAPSARRDYIEWITEAKRPETRAQRLATTIAWVAAGKRRNWKYERGGGKG